MLAPGAGLLFTAPRERCVWADSLTGRPSRSLGEAAYLHLLEQAGLSLRGIASDEGGNAYYDTVRRAA